MSGQPTTPLLSRRDVGILADLRREYHARLCRDILGYRAGTTIYNVADRGSAASVALAEGMADAMGFSPAERAPSSGQTAGSLFTTATRDFLEGALLGLDTFGPARG